MVNNQVTKQRAGTGALLNYLDDPGGTMGAEITRPHCSTRDSWTGCQGSIPDRCRPATALVSPSAGAEKYGPLNVCVTVSYL